MILTTLERQILHLTTQQNLKRWKLGSSILSNRPSYVVARKDFYLKMTTFLMPKTRRSTSSSVETHPGMVAPKKMIFRLRCLLSLSLSHSKTVKKWKSLQAVRHYYPQKNNTRRALSSRCQDWAKHHQCSNGIYLTMPTCLWQLKPSRTQ